MKRLDAIIRTAVAGMAAAMALAGCSTRGVGPATAPAAVSVAAWVTTGDRTRLLARQADLRMAAAAGGATIEIDDARRYQTLSGFGAAITDASAWLINQRMSEAQRSALLDELFGRGATGVGFDLVRLTIGASDFSLSHYSFDDRPPGQTDPTLQHFSIDPHRADVLPIVKRALAVNPELRIMASPWSAPAWMKTSDSLVKGALRPDLYDAFARYLLRFVDAYRAEGVPIFALTVQNEPHFEPDDYPGMRVDSPARAALIGRHLGPMIEARGWKTQIIEWDHNWDQPAAPLEVLADAQARRHVSGVGWHCYASDTLLPNQSVVRDAYPDKDVWFTECSGGEWKPHWPETLPWMTRTLVIGATRHWARGVLMWNLALDENHGPHRGGCKDCRGMVTIDSRSGEVTRNMEYYAFAHASKFVRIGAQRIASTEGAEGLDNVAFRNPDDGSIVLLVCNSTNAPRSFTVAHRGRGFATTLARESIATFVWVP
jgi:glucosylceramidase